MEECEAWPPLNTRILFMWPALTESERSEVERVSDQDGAGWSLLTWRKYKLPTRMQKRWERKATLMPGQQ
eukprot:2046700-Rhodomonas_salina.1